MLGTARVHIGADIDEDTDVDLIAFVSIDQFAFVDLNYLLRPTSVKLIALHTARNLKQIAGCHDSDLESARIVQNSSAVVWLENTGFSGSESRFFPSPWVILPSSAWARQSHSCFPTLQVCA